MGVRAPKRDWTDDEVRWLLENYAGTPNKEAVAYLGRSIHSIAGKVKKMGIRKLAYAKEKKIWDAASDEYVRQHYATGDLSEIAKALGCSEKALYQRARILEVYRDAEHMSKARSAMIRANPEKYVKGQFKKGNVSWNTGLNPDEYLSPESREKMRKNEFKKGNVPHGYRPIGFERVSREGYVEVKLRDTANSKENFELKHHIVYKENFGPIPPGHIVEFLDGNKQNFDPANLILKTRRQNLLDNSLRDTSIVKRQLKIKDPDQVQEYIENHPHIIEVARSVLKVKRKINELTGKTNSTRGPQL